MGKMLRQWRDDLLSEVPSGLPFYALDRTVCCLNRVFDGRVISSRQQATKQKECIGGTEKCASPRSGRGGPGPSDPLWQASVIVLAAPDHGRGISALRGGDDGAAGLGRKIDEVVPRALGQARL